MRRRDREIKDINKITDILNQADVLRLALHDGQYPYIVPVNFWYQQDENQHITLYAHGANQGKKLNLIQQNPSIGFEVDTNHQLITADKACMYSYSYSSIIGQGQATLITDPQEKISTLLQLMRKNVPDKTFTLSESDVRPVTVIKIEVISLTAKEHAMKAKQD